MIKNLDNLGQLVICFGVDLNYRHKSKVRYIEDIILDTYYNIPSVNEIPQVEVTKEIPAYLASSRIGNSELLLLDENS